MPIDRWCCQSATRRGCWAFRERTRTSSSREVSSHTSGSDGGSSCPAARSINSSTTRRGDGNIGTSRRAGPASVSLSHFECKFVQLFGEGSSAVIGRSHAPARSRPVRVMRVAVDVDEASRRADKLCCFRIAEAATLCRKLEGVSRRRVMSHCVGCRARGSAPRALAARQHGR